MSSGRRVLAVLLGSAVVVLGACTDDEPEPEPLAEPTVSVDEAQREYGPLVTDVVDAVAEVSEVTAQPDPPEVIYYDSELASCTYSSTRYEFPVVFGEEVSWDDVRAATERVLEPRGFELTDQLDIPGGYNGFDAVAEDGARFEVRSKLGITSKIDLDAPVQGTCSPEGNETLPPLER